MGKIIFPVDPWLTEKRVDRKKMTVDRIRVVLQKEYVLYGLNLTSEFVYRFLRRVDRKRKLLIDRMEDWPKNRTILFIQNVHFYQNHFFHSVNPPFGQLEVYVFGQDWPKAIRSTGNSVDKGPTRNIVLDGVLTRIS